MEYDVYFGSPDDPPMDWEDAPDPDVDDEELPKTPSSIVAVLGFDPLDDD